MWVQATDAKLYYEDRGDDSRPPLVLLHGLGGSTRSWIDVVPFLEKERRVLACDFRGCGRSERGTSEVGFPRLAEDVLRVLDAAGIENCHVVGHSFGGVVAQELLVHSGSRLASAVLVSTSGKVGEQAAEGWRRLADVVESRGLSTSPASQKRGFSDGFAAGNLEILQRLAAESTSVDKDVYAQFARVAADYDYMEALGRVPHPVLIIQGGADKMTSPAGSVLLERALANGTLEIIDGVGHNAQIELGPRFANRVLEFVDAVEA